MKKFTANYCHSNSNFIITNLPENQVDNAYTSLIRIVQNLLTRGNPTIASVYIHEELNLDRNYIGMLSKVAFLSNEDLNWTETIKGDIIRDDYPAAQFYDDLPEILKSVGFIRNLMIAEYRIQDILPDVTSAFHDQQVDFYIPILKTVIEVDGSGHEDIGQKKLDQQRDTLFERNGITVIRISTKDIRNKSYEQFRVKFRKVYQEHKKVIDFYKKCLEVPRKKMEVQITLTSIARIQVLILELLDRGVISFDDKVWRFNILSKDAERYLNFAFKDLEFWFGHVAGLLNIQISLPEVQIIMFEKSGDFPSHKKQINVDFDLFKRWDDTVISQNTYVLRTDFDDDANHYQMKISEPVLYKIGVEPHLKNLEFVSENVFGYSEFKEGQIEIIINALNGNDTVGLLPTGGGKSLTYQICILLQPAISFVVAPIKSLMLDQIQNLKEKHHITHVGYTNSDLSPKVANEVLSNFGKGKYIFIIISPERFQNKKFREELDRINRKKAVAIATIDEVHCLSEWGHDFRTSYLALANTIRRYTPSARFLALTATASSKVLKDIMTELKIDSHNVMTIKDFTRGELSFEIEEVSSKKKNERLFELLGNSNSKTFIDVGPTLIFTSIVNGKSGCYELSHEIMKKTNLKTSFYSGSKPKKFEIPNFNKYKEGIQESFMKNEIDVLVATKAFGMGIDKNDVRRTIHYGIPSSLESFYQEAGRAGRDGKDSECVILYSPDPLDQKSTEEIFGADTNLEILEKQMKRMSGDLGTALFFLRNSLMDIQAEVDELFIFFQKNFNTEEESISLGFFNERDVGEKERFIYRLALIGVVEDWTIDWSKRRIEVELMEWTESTVIETLENYIQKYDYTFTLDHKESIPNAFLEMNIYFNESDDPFFKRVLTVLLTWYNDNVSYSRKRALLLMKQYADEFTDSDTLQQKIEIYFKRNDDVYFLEKVVGKKGNILDWGGIFFTQEEGKDQQTRPISSFKSLSIVCSRFLQEDNNDPALNLISGMLELKQDNFQSLDGKERLSSAIRDIVKMDKLTRRKMLVSILHTFDSYYDYEKGKLLSDVLITNGFDEMNDLKEIYSNLADPISYRHMVKTLHTTVQKQKVGGYPWEI